MNKIFSELINALDYRNEFSTKEFVIYTILATICAIAIACGESIILSLF